MMEANTPSLVKIKQSASETEARALLYIAVCEVCDFLNVGKNMSDTQIACTVDLILDTYGYMKVEEIKYCFRRAMAACKLYDRLDGNIILGWVADYDAERTEQAMRLSERDAALSLEPQPPVPGAVAFSTYMAQLWDLAAYADPDAIDTLCTLQHIAAAPRALSHEERHKKENAFFQYFHCQYLNGKL